MAGQLAKSPLSPEKDNRDSKKEMVVATARAYVEESSDERIPMPEELSVS